MPLAAEYGALFATALVAATLLPAQSEALLVGMVISGRYDTALLLGAATAGNVAGSAFNWWLGRAATRLESRRWFPVRRASLARAEGWYRRWGRWSLLLAWVPVIGDPLTLVAGVLRERFDVFLALVTIAKLGRYVVVLTVADRFA